MWIPDNKYVNADNSHIGGLAFSSTQIPTSPRVLPEPANNVAAAASQVSCSVPVPGLLSNMRGGGRRGRRRSQIISRVSNRKRRVMSRHSRRKRHLSHAGLPYARRIRNYNYDSHARTMRRRRKLRSALRRHGRRRRTRRHVTFGGAAVAPAYPAGHTQYDLNKIVSNTYSTGGVALGASQSALANPPPTTRLAPEVDNLNHNAPNAYGNTGAGSGFPARGWF